MDYPVTAAEWFALWNVHMPPGRVLAILLLLGLSAFTSGAETAFFSIHKLRLRALSEEEALPARIITQLMANPGHLITTILVMNLMVNVTLGAVLGAHLEDFFSATPLSEAEAYGLAVLAVTFALVFFGEIMPKIVAVRMAEGFARAVAVPLWATDYLLKPFCKILLSFTDLLFRLLHLHELRAAPFITDEELKSVLASEEAQGVIEEEKREMIEGVLEFSDAQVRTIIVPRPDVVALPEAATTQDALDVLRQHEYSRLPVFRDDLDSIAGILVAKDLLPAIAKGELSRPIRPLLRPVHFVPETMTVRQFVKETQRHRAHMAIVVDEYGGTSGLATLHDALQEVVGDILDEDEIETPEYEKVSETEYVVPGSFSIDELAELLNVEFEDEEHTTVAGLVMHLLEKVPETGDTVEHAGLRYVVEECEGKRASRVRIERMPEAAAANGEETA